LTYYGAPPFLYARGTLEIRHQKTEFLQRPRGDCSIKLSSRPKMAIRGVSGRYRIFLMELFRAWRVN
jgi:hypothetical protein